MLYKYYIVFQHSGGTGHRYVSTQVPLDNEEAIRNLHDSLEHEMGRTVVILDWKRID